jgi:hypothetical protein
MKFQKLFYLSMLFLIFGCNSSIYNYTNRKHYTFEKSYKSNDSLLFEKYILFGLSFEGLKNRKIAIENDSIMNIFIHSINKLGLPIQTSNKIENIEQLNCTTGKILKYKNINKKCLKESFIQKKYKAYILPIISLSFGKSTHLSTAGADKYPHFVVILDVAIFIIKNDEVYYYKQMSYVESIDSEYHPYKFEDYKIPIPQKHWDGLVKEVMREYLERRK